MTPDSLSTCSSATGPTPLKTTNRSGLHPSAIAAGTTVNLPVAWLVERIGMDLSLVWVTVVSPGVSNHSGI